jgi:hypothetical protein
MLIEIMGDAGCRVAELVADDLDVDTALQRDRRRRVPGVVEPHDRQPVVTGQPLKAERHLVRRNWRAVHASEHEIVVVVRAERRQPFFRLATPDNEMNPSMLRRWYRDVSIMNTGRVVLWTLRGQGRIFDIINPYVRATWATKLREVRCAVLILDCLTPALGALGLTESNEDVNQFLIAFDALLVEAGVAEALIAHHMGHVEERSRGASRLRDWPEAGWRYVRERDDGREVEHGARFLSAYGRDVDVRETRLDYEPLVRRLALVGGSRAEHALAKWVPAVQAIVVSRAETLGDVIAQAERSGAIRIERLGRGKANHHFIAEVAEVVPPVPGNST